MNYSFFLFSKLHDVILGESDEPYDIQYEYLYVTYNKYVESKYNFPKLGEYECMVEYLQYLKSEKSREKFEKLLVKYKS